MPSMECDHYYDGKDDDDRHDQSTVMMMKMTMTKMMMAEMMMTKMLQYHSRKVDSSRDRLPAILEPSWLV